MAQTPEERSGERLYCHFPYQTGKVAATGEPVGYKAVRLIEPKYPENMGPIFISARNPRNPLEDNGEYTGLIYGQFCRIDMQPSKNLYALTDRDLIIWRKITEDELERRPIDPSQGGSLFLVEILEAGYTEMEMGGAGPYAVRSEWLRTGRIVPPNGSQEGTLYRFEFSDDEDTEDGEVRFYSELFVQSDLDVSDVEVDRIGIEPHVRVINKGVVHGQAAYTWTYNNGRMQFQEV